MRITPMLQQYLRIKAEHADAILLFRLGDFYEMFFEDAEVASRILDITLTSRQRSDGADRIPLCGVPYHAAEPYIARLLAAGWKVAICEQQEGGSRGLMDREVVRVITQGTVLDEVSLEPACPNYLAAIAVAGERYGLAVVEFSTGSMVVTEPSSWRSLRGELERFQVREVVIPEAMVGDHRAELHTGPWAVSVGVAQEGDLGGDQPWHRDWPLAREAAALALGYLAYSHRGALDHLRPAEPYESDQYLRIGGASCRNLELIATVAGNRRGSLLWVLDRTSTAMGARTLRGWLLAPLVDPELIGDRLDAVDELLQGVLLRESVVETLRGMGDFERIAGRVGTRTATPRDLAALRSGLERAARLMTLIEGARARMLTSLKDNIHSLPDTQDLIGRALVDDPPSNLRGGAIIRTGYHAEVDEFRELSRDCKGWIARLEAGERERTGIPSLKVRYNKVFGYYIEVSKPNLHLVPADYQRRQTLVGGERFVTPDLMDYEAKVLGAEERLRALEMGLFEGVVCEVAKHQRELAATAAAIGQLDALVSLADVAHRRGYTRPRVSTDVGLAITDGRHPVVEALGSTGGAFVPNDCSLDPENGHILVITGPNMAGKSTYLRQNALIVVMAQMGSFVPASDAKVGIVDRIFTRVGATDNLSEGESTFMVEMRETADILAGVTPRSLVILDEVGRGTSTFDGVSIAWAVVEHLHNHPTVRPLTLFATHYHELTDLPSVCPRVRNLSTAVREWNGEVVFLRRVVPGPANRSYGIDVARLAGVPDTVVARAREILVNLERGSWREDGLPRPAAGRGVQAPEQRSLFESAGARLERELAAIDVDRLTPLEALNYVGHLVEIARSRS